MEFVFHSPALSEINAQSETFDVPVPVRNDFIATHHTGKDPVESWNFWRGKLKTGDWIPVFYLADDAGILAMGLAQMFRLASTTRVHDGIPADHFSPEMRDYTDLLLGSIGKSGPLAGRVSFGHAVCTSNSPPATTPLWRVLGRPRASFYPNYLCQKPAPKVSDHLNMGNGGQYDTWLSPEIRLRGWKRYAVRSDLPSGTHICDAEVPPPNNNYKTATAFRPLPVGAKFSGTLRFHNLRPHELGAIVWTLTWGGRTDLRHSLGMAKPLGYGSVRVTIKDPDPCDLKDHSGKQHSLKSCRDAFEALLGEKTAGWDVSPVFRELTALANPNTSSKIPDHLFAYPDFPNGFRRAKGGDNNPHKLILPDYTVRAGSPAASHEQARVPARRPMVQSVQSASSGTAMAPAFAKVPEPTGPPPLKIGEWLEGEIIQVGKRLKFLPKDRPEAEAGNIIHPPEGVKAGLKCRAKVNSVSSSGNLFKDLEIKT